MKGEAANERKASSAPCRHFAFPMLGGTGNRRTPRYCIHWQKMFQYLFRSCQIKVHGDAGFRKDIDIAPLRQRCE
jgi:hypothetical protein